MNILAISSWYGANSVRFLVDAMERCGATVFRVGPMYQDHLGMRWEEHELPKVEWELPKDSTWYVDEIMDFATTRGATPDLVFIGEESYHNYIFNTEKVPSVLYSVDGWPENYERIETIKPTIGYTSHPLGIYIRQRTEPDPRWRCLTAACAPWLHRYLGLERNTDFLLLATMYTKRPGICEGIRDRGFSVKTGQEKTEGYVKWCNRSLTTLHNPGYNEIKYRFYESAAMGLLNLSWHTQLFDEQGYRPWVHYVPVSTEETDDGPWAAVESIASVLLDIKRNPAFFRQIADTARVHTVTKHSYYSRVATILSDLTSYLPDDPMLDAALGRVEGAWGEHLA